jgi:hypothetical protein
MSIFSFYNKSRVVALVESRQQLDFFIRFKSAFKRLDIEFVVITDKLSIYLISKILHNINAYIVKPVKMNMDVPDLSLSVEVSSQTLSAAQAQGLYCSIFDCVSEIISSDRQTVCFIWSGYTVASLAMRDAVKRNNVSMLFFERGNSQGKYFVDPWGTNMRSYLYHNPEVLDCKYTSDKIHSKTEDTEILHQNNFLKNISFRINYLFIFDIIYSRLVGLPFRGEKNIVNKILNRAKPYYLKYVTYYNILGLKYYFVALPHSYEMKKQKCTMSLFSEIILNILSKAKIQGVDTVVKFHPDEDDKLFIEALADQKQYGSLFVVSNDIHELVKNAQEVFLFNSSVALEAILQNKIYHFVQRSLFEQFTPQRTANYLHAYLIAPEVEKNGYFTLQTVQEFLKRLSIQ